MSEASDTLPAEKELAPGVNFKIEDNTSIEIPGLNAKASVSLSPDALLTILNSIKRTPEPEPNYITKLSNPLKVYFGSRPLSDVLTERIGIPGSGDVIAEMQNILATPMAAFFAFPGKEFIFVDTPKLLVDIGIEDIDLTELGKIYIAYCLIHEMTHLRQWLSQKGRNQTRVDTFGTAGAKFLGAYGGIFVTNKITDKIDKGSRELTDKKVVSRRKFLKGILSVGGIALSAKLVKVIDGKYYEHFNKSEVQALYADDDKPLVVQLWKEIGLTIE